MTKRLTLQFHVTGNCNLRCRHCYRAQGAVEPLSLEDVLNTVEQFRALRQVYNETHGIKKRGHINLTGGEPFMRKDIDEIIRYIARFDRELTYGVLTNGSFLDASRRRLLCDTGVSFVQVSLDGDRRTHDALRAEGDHDRVLAAAKALCEDGIRTFVSFTAHKENYRQFPAVARACRKRGVDKVWTDRIVPIGGGAEMASLAIGVDTIDRYTAVIKKAQSYGNAVTQVSAGRALQFLGADGGVYRCGAGTSLITVDEFGQIMPCRRMPIVCGSVLTDTLTEVYHRHEVFRRLQADKIPRECVGCEHALSCGGGAKCQSYAVYGDFDRADPACKLAAR